MADKGFGVTYVSSEAKEEERLQRLLSGKQDRTPKKFNFGGSSTTTQTPTTAQSPAKSTNNAQNFPSGAGILSPRQGDSPLQIQVKAIKTAISNAERDISATEAKIIQHENNIDDYLRKIDQEKEYLDQANTSLAEAQAIAMEKMVELESINEQIAEEEQKEKDKEQEKAQKALEKAREKEEFEAKIRAEKESLGLAPVTSFENSAQAQQLKPHAIARDASNYQDNQNQDSQSYISSLGINNINAIAQLSAAGYVNKSDLLDVPPQPDQLKEMGFNLLEANKIVKALTTATPSSSSTPSTPSSSSTIAPSYTSTPTSNNSGSTVSVSSAFEFARQQSAQKVEPNPLPKRESVPVVKKDTSNMSELEKEQERLMRTITKDPSKQPVKVAVAPVAKPVVQPKPVVVVPQGPSLLEKLMEKEGTPKTFRWETWDSLDTVSLIGSFTEWELVPMPRVKGVFTVTLPISPGTHIYRYKVNNKFELEKGQPKAMAPDGEFGTKFQI